MKKQIVQPMKELTLLLRKTDPLLQIPETGDGFLYEPKQEEQGMLVRTFICKGETGDYRIRVKLRAKSDVREYILFVGRRALVFRGSMKKGEIFECSSMTNLSKIIPRYQEKPMTMKYVCVSLASEQQDAIEIMGISAERIVDNVPIHLWMCGDSTVTDQTSGIPYQPQNCYSAWGQMLTAFLSNNFVVSNHAHCGLTTESFREEGHYAIIREFLRPGDLVFFQFGHNDQKLSHLMPDTGYRKNLIRYIEEIRSMGGIPVLVTPLARNTWKQDGSYNDLLLEYADMVRLIGTEYQVDVLDLHRHSVAHICANGFAASSRLFHPQDMTHTNDFGAFQMARFIVEELKRTGLARNYHMLHEASEGMIWEVPKDSEKHKEAGTDHRDRTGEQRELFDDIEKSANDLIRMIEEAKSNGERKG